MLRRSVFRARLRLHRWFTAAKGYRVYLLALLLALPDMLDALAGVDLTPFVPPGYSAKVASGLAIARILVGIYIRRLPPPPPPGVPR